MGVRQRETTAVDSDEDAGVFATSSGAGVPDGLCESGDGDGRVAEKLERRVALGLREERGDDGARDVCRECREHRGDASDQARVARVRGPHLSVGPFLRTDRVFAGAREGAASRGGLAAAATGERLKPDRASFCEVELRIRNVQPA